MDENSVTGQFGQLMFCFHETSGKIVGELRTLFASHNENPSMTNLTLDQALQQGIEAHKAGQLQEADRLYTAILKTQPKHPDANHNMGVLAVGVGKVEQALPFFKTALEANPGTAQFWLSYIDALIKLEQLADAKVVLDQAKSKGAKGNSFEKLEQQLQEAGKEPLAASKTPAEATPQQPNILDSLKLDQAISLAKKKAKEGSPEEARRVYQDILTKFPKNKRASEELTGLAGKSSAKTYNAPKDKLQSLLVLYNKGQLVLVVEQAKALTKQYPEAFDVWHLMALAAAQIGQLDQAIFAFNKVIAIKPDYAEAFNNMGLALQKQGKLQEAIEAYNKALAIKPDYAAAHYNKGNDLQEQGKLQEAVKAYNQALAIKPEYADAYNNMGLVLQKQDKLEEAIEAYTKALTIKPSNAEAYNNMGGALKEQGKLEEAIEAYNKALAIKPDYAEACNNMGVTLKEQGKLEEAIEAYNKALTIKPDYAEAHNNMSFAKLLTSSWREGIELRKWRWHTQKHQRYVRTFSAREWDGKELPHNKTLLVWAEQGPGDVVIWSSCISHYANIFRKIIIECHPKLMDLLERSFPNILVRSSEDRSSHSSEDFDFHVSMETLFGYAYLVGACTETQSSYLFPNPERVKYWSTKLRNISNRTTVGLSWKSPVMTTQRAKNYPSLSYWGKTLQKYRSKFTFVNLQSTDYQHDIEYLKSHFECEIVHFDQLDLYNDLSDVAALSQALDCIISVATAAATISAAVGTQTIIPTWRQSPWNNILFNSRGPAVDILQKNTTESWAPVFEKVTTKLKMLNTEY